MGKFRQAFMEGYRSGKEPMEGRGMRSGPPVMLRPDLENAREMVDETLDVAEDSELAITALLTGIRDELRYMNDRQDAFHA